MSLRIRLARGGAKKKPFYRIVVSDARAPRDGRFIERVGTYDPRLPKDSETRVVLREERIRYWLERGAKPSDRVARFLGSAEIIQMPVRNNPEKSKPKAKAQARLEAEREAAEAAKAAPADGGGEAAQEG